MSSDGERRSLSKGRNRSRSYLLNPRPTIAENSDQETNVAHALLKLFQKQVKPLVTTNMPQSTGSAKHTRTASKVI